MRTGKGNEQVARSCHQYIARVTETAHYNYIYIRVCCFFLVARHNSYRKSSPLFGTTCGRLHNPT